MKVRSTSFLLLAAVTSAACATGDAGRWSQVQRERLERAHVERSLDDALREVLLRAPAATAPQEPRPASAPRHIDQREPPRAGDGSRAFRTELQPLVVRADYGLGRAGVHVRGTRYDDASRARFAHLAVDAANGAALHADLIGSDDALFHGVLHNDGVDPQHADADLVDVDVFPHFRFDTDLGAVRVGAFVDWLQLDHAPSHVTREWLGIGPRVEWEPRVRLLGSEARGLDLFVRAAGDVGATWFHERYRGGSDGDATWRWGSDLGAGVRLDLHGAEAELGWRWRRGNVQQTTGELFGSRAHSTFDSEQLYFGFGVVF